MKTQLRWEYPPQDQMHTIRVRDIYNQGSRAFTLLRPCQYGYNDQGIPVKKLYCTRGLPGKNPLFFAPKGDGWSEQQPCFNHMRRKDAGLLVGHKSKGGGYDCPFMSHFGNVPCHRAVAYAWCKHPEEAQKDPEWYKYGHGYECDHKNCDHGNFNADNLEWVKTPENRRRRYEVEEPLRKELKKIGITNPNWVLIENWEDLFTFVEVQLEYFFERLPAMIASHPGELTIENINDAISATIDLTIRSTIHCTRCDAIMILDTEEHALRDGRNLCDCCYDELYG